MQNISKILILFILINCTNNLGYSQFIKLNPQKSITQYTLKSWTIDDGLPSNALKDIIQTTDGYIWIASYGGIIRFDGIDFTVFTSINTQALLTEACKFLREDKNGTLWIGTQKGIALYKNNTFYRNKRLEFLDNCNIESLYIDRNNIVWIGTNANGFFRYENDSLIHIESLKNYTNSAVYAIFEDDEENIWIGTFHGELLKFKNNRIIPCDMDNTTAGIFTFFQDHEGTIWAGASTDVFTIVNDKLLKQNLLDRILILDITSDYYKLLWFSSSSAGMFRYNTNSGNLVRFSKENGLPNNQVTKILFDKQGNLWGTTYRKGLFQITDGKFTCYSKSEGLNSDITTAIFEHSEGVYWIASENGVINILENGKISELLTKTQLNPQLKHIFKDSKENLWISSYGGLLKISNQKEELYNIKNGFPDNYIRLTFEDSKGNIWIGTNRTGLHRFNPDGSLFTINLNTGLSSNYVMAINENHSGQIVVGTKNGINIIEHDKVIRQYQMKDGLPDNLIFNIYIDEDGIMWFSTNSGICRMQDSKLTVLSTESGLVVNTVYDILEDNSGNFWMPGPKGIMKASKKQLNDFSKGNIDKIDCKFYDKSDGMKSSVCLGATKSLKAKDGKLWFTTAGGIASIDPENISINTELPTVIIEKITTSDSSYHDDIIKIHPENKRFTIKFTALDYISPEKIQFKYKLEPFENKWIDAGTKRTVSYTNIDPGTYTFKVLSTNSYGIWNETSSNVQIIVLPAWYQTMLFKIALFVFIFGGIILWYRSRINRIKRQRNILEEKVKIRTKQVVQQKEEITQQRDEIIDQKKEITDSIVYSRHIQNAILPNDELIKNIFPDSFIFSRPKDIIGGDFYWISQRNDEIVVAVADCTGHGVPGALMSMLGITFLNEIVKNLNITDPGEILDLMRLKIIRTLNQTDAPDSASDGMDVAICTLYPKQNYLKYAGANNSIILISNKTLKEVIANKMPISYTHMLDKSFTTIEENYKPGDMLYLYSDGYIDQFGGPEKRRFLKNNFRNTLLEASLLPVDEQFSHTSNVFDQWKGDLNQLDDVTVLGVRLSF